MTVYELPDIERAVDGARFGVRVVIAHLHEDVEVRVMGFRVTARVERETYGQQVSEVICNVVAHGSHRLGPMGLRRLWGAAYGAILEHVETHYPAVWMH